MKSRDGRPCPPVMAPHRAAHREEIGAGVDQRLRVHWRDTADGDAGNFEQGRPPAKDRGIGAVDDLLGRRRSEEHTSELQSLMRNSYAVFGLKKNTYKIR